MGACAERGCGPCVVRAPQYRTVPYLSDRAPFNRCYQRNGLGCAVAMFGARGGALCAIGDAVCLGFIYFPFLLAARPTPLPFPCSFPP